MKLEKAQRKARILDRVKLLNNFPKDHHVA
jgi:hypothetical protein